MQAMKAKLDGMKVHSDCGSNQVTYMQACQPI